MKRARARARTERPILLLGAILLGLAWPALGEEIEDDGALEDTIRGQREQKPLDEASVANEPAIEPKQRSDTTVPPGGDLGQPDADGKRGDSVDRDRPPGRRQQDSPTPDEQQRIGAQEPERKQKLAEKLVTLPLRITPISRSAVKSTAATYVAGSAGLGRITAGTVFRS